MILQLRQMRLTDASTFIFQLLIFGFWRSQPIARCFLRRDLYISRKVIRTTFNRSYRVLNHHFVAGKAAEVLHAHIAGSESVHNAPVFQFHSERN
jgi:hypothetical protein